MNRFTTERKKYESNLILKTEFIENMFHNHKILFEYSEYLKSGLISEIIIRDDKIIAKSRRNNIKLYCDPVDQRSIPIEMLNFGLFEDIEINSVCRLISKYLPDNFVALDIGGNIGWYAIELAKQFPNSSIFSFEPIPETFKKLNDNLLLNEISNVKSFNFGFSNRNEELIFFYDKNLTGGTSIKNILNKEIIEKIECPVKKMDDVIDSITDRVDFIKCDVEGAELFVYQGGLKTIEKHKPIIYSEMLRKWAAKFNYHPNDIINLLHEIGYDCFSFNANGELLLIRSITDNTVETNFIFIDSNKYK